MKLFLDNHFIAKIKNYSLAITTILLINSCATHKPQYGKNVSANENENATDTIKIAQTFYLVGDAGNADAKFIVGFIFESDETVEPDYSMALDCFLKANDARNVDAMFHIGYMYKKGLEVARLNLKPELGNNHTQTRNSIDGK